MKLEEKFSLTEEELGKILGGLTNGYDSMDPDYAQGNCGIMCSSCVTCSSNCTSCSSCVLCTSTSFDKINISLS